MRQWIILGTLFLVAVGTYSCWETSRDVNRVEDSTLFYGRVQTESAGNTVPVGGVTLRMKDQETFTDSRGFFAFRNIPLGNHTLEVLVAGQVKESLPVKTSGERTRLPDITIAQ